MPQGRPKGAKARGLTYERALAKAVPKAKAGLWWEYQDDNGLGYCQTDLVLIGREAALVLEAKYTWVEQAWTQLERLYVPVLGLALARPVFGVQVCKILKPETEGRVVGTLKEAFAAVKLGERVTWHWIGKGWLGQDGD
jgi:hypothetical protein